jgi:hypothetical protein
MARWSAFQRRRRNATCAAGEQVAGSPACLEVSFCVAPWELAADRSRLSEDQQCRECSHENDHAQPRGAPVAVERISLATWSLRWALALSPEFIMPADGRRGDGRQRAKERYVVHGPDSGRDCTRAAKARSRCGLAAAQAAVHSCAVSTRRSAFLPTFVKH